MKNLDTMLLNIARYKNKIDFVAVISKIISVIEEKFWVIDYRAIIHICVNMNTFISYNDVGEGKQLVYVDNFKRVAVIDKE